MGKPRLIVLIRHAQSEGNKNRDIHQTVPDHRVQLTPEGHQQALEAGRKLRALLRPDDTLHFFTSPYRRTRQTTEGILKALTSDEPSRSPFPRHTVKVYEEPRLREQDFGNFQPGSTEMERMWQERADYGHFFYRIPNGESAADAYDRISGFNDSLWRQFEEKDFASVCILVTHGLMTRVFLMKWYHFSVEYFEDLRNVNHCEFVVMKKSIESGKYMLQNHLRTWTELKRERAARDSVSKTPGGNDSPIPQRRIWGGCAKVRDPKNHENRPCQPLVRQNTLDLFSDDNDTGPSTLMDTDSSPCRRAAGKAIQSRPLSRERMMLAQSSLSRNNQNGSGCASESVSPIGTVIGNGNERSDQFSADSPSKSSSTSSSLANKADSSIKHRVQIPKPLSSLGDPFTGHGFSSNLDQDDVSTPRPFHVQSLADQAPLATVSPDAVRKRLRSTRGSSSGVNAGDRLSRPDQSDTASSSSPAEELAEGRASAKTTMYHDEGYQDEGAEGDAETETDNETEPDDDNDNGNDNDGQNLSRFLSLARSSTTTTSTTSTTLLSNTNPENPSPPLLAAPLTSLRLTTPTTPPMTAGAAMTTTMTATTATVATVSTHERAMADFLGDQSDAEVTEDDEEMGIKLRQKGEEDWIWEQERSERDVVVVMEGSSGGGG